MESAGLPERVENADSRASVAYRAGRVSLVSVASVASGGYVVKRASVVRRD